jgi:hypothetical protein
MVPGLGRDEISAGRPLSVLYNDCSFTSYVPYLKGISLAATRFPLFLGIDRMQIVSLCKPFYFRFYDVGVRLVSDCPGYFDLFVQNYARFQVSGENAPAAYHVDAALLTKGNTRSQRPILWLDGEEWPLNDTLDTLALRDHLFEYIFATIAARVRSHILIHAAVVERDGSAVLIAGDSQHGKSSLALGLLRRGFRLHSDELAAIARTDGRVHPFPRKVRATSRSLALAGYDVAPDEFPLWLGKYLVDVERLPAATTSAPTPIREIVLLSEPSPHGAAQQDFMRVTVDRLDDLWLASLERTDGVAALYVDHSANFPAVLIQTKKKAAVLASVDALCQAHRVLCLEVQKRAPHQPSFTQAPQVVPLSKSLAVMELLRHFQGTHGSVILQEEHGGSAASFYMEMADLVDNVRCHRLYVGHYQESLDLICDLSR